jgi:hypothetical protein
VIPDRVVEWEEEKERKKSQASVGVVMETRKGRKRVEGLSVRERNKERMCAHTTQQTISAPDKVAFYE